jgi:serine/threonine protein phosphatase PrpC
MEKDNNKKNKISSNQRFLSPSFKKGAVKENKDEEFKINLIMDGMNENEETMSPNVKKSKKSKRLSLHEGNVLQQVSGKKRASNEMEAETIDKITEQAKKLNIAESHIKNLAYMSQAGKGEDGFTKVNQDSYLVIQDLYKLGDFNIFGVLDGHGMNGHLVSQFVVKYFNSYLKKNKKLNILENLDDVYAALKKNNYEIIRKAFNKAESEISKSEIDANFSGTTCVLLFQIGEKLLTANVGDSRAIIVKGKEAIPLSIDQKPNDENEMKRIIKNGGEVSQYEEDGFASGPFRVWKKGQMYPGIAMSRSIGDLLASTLGVIPEPEVREERLDNKTKFIVICSDGVWEFLDNKAVKDLVMPFYEKNDPEGACKKLINESTKWWNEEDVVVDDITVIVIFF